MHVLTLLIILTASALCLPGCNADRAQTDGSHPEIMQMGSLPEPTQALLDEEYKLYRARHLDMTEAEAKRQFDIIQVMSQENGSAFTAAWAERRALANAWLKANIEDVYNASTVPDEMLQAAADAYAFKSGHPALVTASHILIRTDKLSSVQERRAALEAIRSELLKKSSITDDDLRGAAMRLTKAGFRADMNADLTFPRRPMTSFMGESLNHQAVVEPFANAAFALSPSQPLSEVTETEFGFHLILFKSRSEEQKADIQEDRAFLLSSIVSQGRTLAARQQIDALMQSADIRVDEKRLADLVGAQDQANK